MHCLSWQCYYLIILTETGLIFTWAKRTVASLTSIWTVFATWTIWKQFSPSHRCLMVIYHRDTEHQYGNIRWCNWYHFDKLLYSPWNPRHIHTNKLRPVPRPFKTSKIYLWKSEIKHIRRCFSILSTVCTVKILFLFSLEFSTYGHSSIKSDSSRVRHRVKPKRKSKNFIILFSILTKLRPKWL